MPFTPKRTLCQCIIFSWLLCTVLDLEFLEYTLYRNIEIIIIFEFVFRLIRLSFKDDVIWQDCHCPNETI